MPRPLRPLIDLAYAAAVDPLEWTSFLRELGAVTQSDIVPFLVWDYSKRDGKVLRLYPLDETTMREYVAWAPHNPYVRQSPRLQAGQIRIIHPSEGAIERSAFYNEWLRPRLGVGHNIALTVFSDPMMSVQLSPLRDPKKLAYGPKEARVLTWLGPHVRRAITIERKLGQLELERRSAAAALDHAPSAMLVLDGGGRVVFFNRAARALLDQRDGLTLDARGFLAASRATESTRLGAVVAGACATGAGNGSHPGGALRISRPSNSRPFHLLVSPLRHPPSYLVAYAPCAIVFVTEPDRVPTDSQSVLRELFAMTPAEARIACLLADGHRVSEIAEKLALRQATIRTHLKRLFEKTDSRTQGDLMRILCAIPTHPDPDYY
ncbi:MAG: helix-turn-helix transcriptional regulator [Candidatus Binatia bacterium]